MEFSLLFFLLAGHALMDFAIQGDMLAICKCRKANHVIQKQVPWPYWLTAHAFIHGATVGVIIRWFGFDMMTATIYACVETIIHWVADLLKCEEYTSIHVDQTIHIICKIAWTFMLVNGVTYPAWVTP